MMAYGCTIAWRPMVHHAYPPDNVSHGLHCCVKVHWLCRCEYLAVYITICTGIEPFLRPSGGFFSVRLFLFLIVSVRLRGFGIGELAHQDQRRSISRGWHRQTSKRLPPIRGRAGGEAVFLSFLPSDYPTEPSLITWTINTRLCRWAEKSPVNSFFYRKMHVQLHFLTIS